LKDVIKINIIIFGQMGSGKSTLADYLCNTYKYTKFSFGAKIHSECELFGQHDRMHLQQYGQMMRKIFHQNIWCDYVFTQTQNKDKIVIDDGRQLNEFNFFANLGYLPVGVIADKNKRIERLIKRVDYEIDPKTFNHETESQARECVKKCKIKIYNNSDDINDLIKEIENKIGGYLGGI